MARLKAKIRSWIDWKCREVNYYVTKTLSGHGFTPPPDCIYEEEKVIADAELFTSVHADRAIALY